MLQAWWKKVEVAHHQRMNHCSFPWLKGHFQQLSSRYQMVEYHYQPEISLTCLINSKTNNQLNNLLIKPLFDKMYSYELGIERQCLPIVVFPSGRCFGFVIWYCNPRLCPWFGSQRFFLFFRGLLVISIIKNKLMKYTFSLLNQISILMSRTRHEKFEIITVPRRC